MLVQLYGPEATGKPPHEENQSIWGSAEYVQRTRRGVPRMPLPNGLHQLLCQYPRVVPVPYCHRAYIGRNGEGKQVAQLWDVLLNMRQNLRACVMGYRQDDADFTTVWVRTDT